MRLQQLDPASARLCLNIERICHQKLPPLTGKKLILAVSGGADSTALALAFSIIAPRLGAEIRAVHINHHIRAGAGRDADFCARFCADLGITCTIIDANVPELARTRKLGLEEAGRNMRLEILERERVAGGDDYILQAHHARDLAEDILMRLTRGAGWPALGGMAWQSGRILRPLLQIVPEDLRSLLIVCGVSWREDESNQSLQFMRNRYRHVLLPLLRCENPAVETGFARLHEQAAIDADFWEKTLDDALAACPWKTVETPQAIQLLLPRKLLDSLHPAARIRIYHRAIRQLHENGDGQNRADTLFCLERAFRSGVGGKLVQCGGGIGALCQKQGILFSKAAKTC